MYTTISFSLSSLQTKGMSAFFRQSPEQAKDLTTTLLVISGLSLLLCVVPLGVATFKEYKEINGIWFGLQNFQSDIVILSSLLLCFGLYFISGSFPSDERGNTGRQLASLGFACLGAICLMILSSIYCSQKAVGSLLNHKTWVCFIALIICTWQAYQKHIAGMLTLVVLTVLIILGQYYSYKNNYYQIP